MPMDALKCPCTFALSASLVLLGCGDSGSDDGTSTAASASAAV